MREARFFSRVSSITKNGEISLKDMPIKLDQNSLVYVHDSGERIRLGVFNKNHSIVLNDAANKAEILDSQYRESVLIGTKTLEYCANTENDVAIGFKTMSKSALIGQNTAVGSHAMNNCQDVQDNTALGHRALQGVMGNGNTAAGINVGANVDAKSFEYNMLFGKNVLYKSKGFFQNLTAIGQNTLEGAEGTFYDSVFIGKNAGFQATTQVRTSNLICIGSRSGQKIQDMSDSIIIGSENAEGFCGTEVILIGHGVAKGTDGFFQHDIIIGSNTFKYRQTKNGSKNICMGYEAGSLSSPSECLLTHSVTIGNWSSYSSYSSYSLAIGEYAGAEGEHKHSVNVGFECGRASATVHSVNIGAYSGRHLTEQNSVMIGYFVQGKNVEDSTLIGSSIGTNKSLYKKSVVLGTKAAYHATGMLNEIVAIGADAGSGQDFSKNDGAIYLGCRAGQGSNSQSSNVICIGKDAGKGDVQKFENVLFVGHNAASYGTEIKDTVLLGHDAGVNMVGEKVLAVGHHAGYGLKGNNCILLGHHAGYNLEANDKLIVGDEKSSIIYADMAKGNIAFGVAPANNIWTESGEVEHCMYWTHSNKHEIKLGKHNKGGVTYVNHGQLMYVTGTSAETCLNPTIEHYHAFSRHRKPIDESTNLMLFKINFQKHYQDTDYYLKLLITPSYSLEFSVSVNQANNISVENLVTNENFQISIEDKSLIFNIANKSAANILRKDFAIYLQIVPSRQSNNFAINWKDDDGRKSSIFSDVSIDLSDRGQIELPNKGVISLFSENDD